MVNVQLVFVDAGYQPYRKAHLSMHQMGSCRQGASPQDSVTDGEGQCWDVANLYVADASAFPTATGMQAPDTSATVMPRPWSFAYACFEGRRILPVKSADFLHANLRTVWTEHW